MKKIITKNKIGETLTEIEESTKEEIQINNLSMVIQNAMWAITVIIVVHLFTRIWV